MTHKHISKIGMGRQISKRLFFSLTKFHSSSTPFSVWIVIVWWWVWLFPPPRTGRPASITANNTDWLPHRKWKNQQTTGVPGVVSEIKEQSFSVKKVIECAGLIVCVSLSRWKYKHTKRKWLTPKKKKKEKRISCVLNWEEEVAKNETISIIFVLSYFPEAAGRISFDSFTRIKSLGFSLVSGGGGVLKVCTVQ